MEDKRRSVEEIRAAQKVFEDAAEQMFEHAKNEKTEEGKRLFQQENFINYKLAELCKWFRRKESMFDKVEFEKLSTKEVEQDAKKDT